MNLILSQKWRYRNDYQWDTTLWSGWLRITETTCFATDKNFVDQLLLQCSRWDSQREEVDQGPGRWRSAGTWVWRGGCSASTSSTTTRCSRALRGNRRQTAEKTGKDGADTSKEPSKEPVWRTLEAIKTSPLRVVSKANKCWHQTSVVSCGPQFHFIHQRKFGNFMNVWKCRVDWSIT